LGDDSTRIRRRSASARSIDARQPRLGRPTARSGALPRQTDGRPRRLSWSRRPKRDRRGARARTPRIPCNPGSPAWTVTRYRRCSQL